MTIYRRLYEQHFGPIPLDEDGRTYDIHHIDGNRKNNDPSNLVALSIKEHYKVHHEQGDKGACLAISMRMESTPEERSELSRQSALERVKNGTHNWTSGDLQRKTTKRRLEDGTHHFLGESNPSIKRMKDGTHPFCDNERQRQLSKMITRKRLDEGTHNFLNQPDIECPYCGKIGQKGAMYRWHFDNCKMKGK